MCNIVENSTGDQRRERTVWTRVVKKDERLEDKRVNVYFEGQSSNRLRKDGILGSEWEQCNNRRLCDSLEFMKDCPVCYLI